MAMQSIQKDASAGSACFVRSDGVETDQRSGWISLVMGFFKGRPLARIGKRFDAFAIVKRIAHGLALMHKLGMVHRDLTPNNILIGDATKDADIKMDGTKKPDIRIVDLGLVRFMSPQAEDGQLSRGVAIGTPEYMPPEVYERFSAMEPPSDVFALASTLYFLLEGRAPFNKSRSFMDSFPVPEDGSKDLRELFLRATDRRLERRYQNVGEFLKQLELCDQMTTTNIWRTTSRPVRRRDASGEVHMFRGADSVQVQLWQCKELDGPLEFKGATVTANWSTQSLKLRCPAWVTVTTPAVDSRGNASGPARVVQEIFRPNQEIPLPWDQPAELVFRRLNNRARYSCEVKWPRTDVPTGETDTGRGGVEFSFAKLDIDAPQDLCRIVLQHQREEQAP